MVKLKSIAIESDTYYQEESSQIQIQPIQKHGFAEFTEAVEKNMLVNNIELLKHTFGIVSLNILSLYILFPNIESINI